MKTKLNQWIWRWHVIAGIICLPIVLLLSITGGIYLFKDNYEKDSIQALKQVSTSSHLDLTYQDQWNIAKKQWNKTPTGLIVPKKNGEATQFISGRFSHKSSLFLNPKTGEVNGFIQQNRTDMHKIRKLHGELLLGAFGTKIVELVASWMIVLILSGLYIFWPKNKNYKALFTIRTHAGKRIFYRDLHAVFGFWFSLLTLLILAGGMPWTDVFGSGYKWVQKQSNSGFSKEWQGRTLRSKPSGSTLPLDVFVKKAKELNLVGEVSISLPKSPQGVYSISNQTSQLTKMHTYHFDQYSGKQLYHGTWDDIGILMKTRLWVMAFHQGQFGLWNWILVLLTAIGLTFLSIAGLISNLKRKENNQLNFPSPPRHFKTPVLLLGIILVLSVLLPMFGLSVLVIFLLKTFTPKLRKII